MSSLMLTMNGSSRPNPMQNWHRTSVREFFSNLNWEGGSAETQSGLNPLTKVESEPLNLAMSVNRFFSVFNWEGGDVGVPLSSFPTDAPLPNLVDDLTLDDFSDLF